MEIEKVNVFENIEKVIFNKPATIVIFKDDSKLVTKCSESDIYDPFVGYLVVLAKYVLPNKYSLVKLLENTYYPDIYFTNCYHNNVAYTILNDKTNNSKYVTDGVDILGNTGVTGAQGPNEKPGNDAIDIFSDDYYNYETRKLICLLKCFANDYNKYKDEFIIRVYNMLKTNIRDKKQLNHIYSLKKFKCYDDTKISDMYKHIGNDTQLAFDFGADVIVDDINDSILKILPTMNVYGCYPESLIKGCEDQRCNVNVPLFAKKIDYTKYIIDKCDSVVNNAGVYTQFITAFNSTGKCSVDEYRWHGLLGLMSELGELKEVLTEIIYTANASDEMIDHMDKELSDICWMLCEYTTYCDRSLVSYSFATYIHQSILFHQINYTKHFDYNSPIASNNGPYNVAIDVVDKIILNVSKIANIYQKMLQGHSFKEFEDQHFEVLFDIYKNVVYLSQYVLDISLTNVFSISMDKVKKRYPDGWMDPERSINRKPEDI